MLEVNLHGACAWGSTMQLYGPIVKFSKEFCHKACRASLDEQEASKVSTVKCPVRAGNFTAGFEQFAVWANENIFKEVHQVCAQLFAVSEPAGHRAKLGL